MEHPYALIGKEALAQNVKALKEAFFGKRNDDGTAGFGFVSYLVASQASTDISQLSANFNQVELNLNDVPGGQDFYDLFEDFYVTDDSEVAQDQNNYAYLLYQSTKKVTDWLKTEFVVDLNTGLPGSVQGDND